MRCAGLILSVFHVALAASKSGKGSGSSAAGGGAAAGAGGISDLASFADSFKDADKNPEAAAAALSQLDASSLGESMASLMVQSMDKDGNGILTEEEISGIAIPAGVDTDTITKAKDMFVQMDGDGDGQVTGEEARKYFSKLGDTLKGMSSMLGGGSKGKAASTEL
mmetsp:Transcript_4944/g.11531  ORF Transcript_4944/g.11531 Transcript_4944/m.11531 type:complete len:166 (+) Transcript_4944:116-613(+)